MNVLVLDVAADSGGALAVLNDFCDYVKRSPAEGIVWYFVTGLAALGETETVRAIREPWVKKSWLHRIWFDAVTVRKLAAEYRIDKVLSLQNLCVPGLKLPQAVFVHQSIPFSSYRFRLSDRDEWLPWIYQNMIGKRIVASVEKADAVFVQTDWMKEACVKAGASAENVFVCRPEAGVKAEKVYDPARTDTFFYPAEPFSYKNHAVILEACRLLRERGCRDFRVSFTLSSRSLPEKLARKIRPLGGCVELLGRLSRREVMERYAGAVLLYPSYVETLGLPLLEARRAGDYILAADCPYAHENLDGYPNAVFFEPHDARRLSLLMEDLILKKVQYQKAEPENPAYGDGWKTVVDTVRNIR